MTAPTNAQHLTSDGKEALRKTIRGLRERLIVQLKEEAEREYRLGVALDEAQLPEAKARRRARIEAWADEQSRTDWAGGKPGKSSKKKASAKTKASAAQDPTKQAAESAKAAPKKPSDKQLAALRERYLLQAVKEAAHTLVNRLVIVRILEAGGLSKPAVLTGGWKSAGYREFTEYAGALCSDAGALRGGAADDSKGYGALLQLLFDELAVELPGVFGKVGLTSLFPVPAATLREVVEALNDPALDSAWGDDTTLGWVYQFWNDPDFEALNDKLAAGGKLEPHEIAPKTQMFTERYQVNWLLQNTLGQKWSAICAKQGWPSDFETIETELRKRRALRLDARKVSEEAMAELLPIESPDEERWKYRIATPVTEADKRAAPDSLRELKLLDPACGSGHFLVIAFDLLSALYHEEARHRGEVWTDEQIATWIVGSNLHGIDIDPRAIQIAAAAVWLKAKLFAPRAKLTRMNLVAPTFKLAALPSDDPALLRLETQLKREVGIPETLTRQLVDALSGVDHLGTLLRVDSNIRDALAAYAKDNFGIHAPAAQTSMFAETELPKLQLSLSDAMASVIRQLGRFLDAHEGASDLGLRLEGEQLAAGVRFLQIAQEGSFDLVVGNPPYQGTSKMAEAGWFKKHYPRSKSDLYACFLERGLELTKPGGMSALLTMRGWMFLSTYEALREEVARVHGIRMIADLQYRAFAEIGNIVVAMSIVQKGCPVTTSVALRPRTPARRVEDMPQLMRNVAGLEYQDERYEFDVAKLSAIEGTPLVYWWDETFLDEYIKAPKLGDVAPARFGLNTGNNVRFLRKPYEINSNQLVSTVAGSPKPDLRALRWTHFLKGAAGTQWVDACDECIEWSRHGLQVKQLAEYLYGSYSRQIRNERVYWTPGVAFTMIGSSFSARAHRFSTVIGDKGSSVYSSDVASTVSVMNRSRSREILNALNPSVSFQVGDVNRLAVFPVDDATGLYRQALAAFTLHESHREPSVEFKSPGPSPWRYAQDWAQRAVDREQGEPLPPYEPELDAPDPTAFVSFAIGVALGRFGENGEGILDLSLPASAAPTQALSSSAAAPIAGAKTKAASNGKSPSPPRSSQPAPKAAGSSSAPSSGANPSDTGSSYSGSSHSGASHSGAKQRSANHSGSGAAGESDTADALSPEVPNIEPSPLPAGQEILPSGILFVCAAPNVKDSLEHPAAARIDAAWQEHGAAITGSKKTSLAQWLCKDFFAYHKSLYENRPIYLPLSSEGKNFVAWVSIHQWADNTLQALLASHLHPALQRLQGEINDLNAARASSDKAQKASAEKQYAKSQKLLEDLEQFITDVTQCAERGAPPTDAKCPPREVDAAFVMDLDDGVMINSAALWPLLTPQWKDPKKWWKELCAAQGRKDYDWAHLSARYFPTRVDEKCQTDPSLGVAHACFWKYHPAKAYAWELRLKDEIAPDFTIDEPGSNDARATFLAEHAGEAEELRAKEQQRRERNRKKAAKAEANEDNGDSESFALTGES